VIANLVESIWFIILMKVIYVSYEFWTRLSDERLSLISQRMHDLSFPKPLSITGISFLTHQVFDL